MLAAVRRGSSLVGNPAGEYFFKVSNCAQKSSHLRFNFLSIGASPRPSPVSEAPEYRRHLRKRAPCFGALAIKTVEKRDAASPLVCPKAYQWVRRKITRRPNCPAGSC